MSDLLIGPERPPSVTSSESAGGGFVYRLLGEQLLRLCLAVVLPPMCCYHELWRRCSAWMMLLTVKQLLGEM
ncbi:unnamed protein product [Pleuronectes platessa]|uniref:Uncharacterized protein n=1 Tax=Pleuronectes platessa TaxID=8262 RepID=A0A9N7Z6Z1_PLEPL|nr:unnamed protein product [Pleuronectes platessa]